MKRSLAFVMFMVVSCFILQGTEQPLEPKEKVGENVIAMQLGVFASHLAGLGGYYEYTTKQGFGVGFELIGGLSILGVATDRDISYKLVLPGIRLSYAFSQTGKSEWLLGVSYYPRVIREMEGLSPIVFFTPFLEYRTRKSKGINFRIGGASLSVGYMFRF